MWLARSGLMSQRTSGRVFAILTPCRCRACVATHAVCHARARCSLWGDDVEVIVVAKEKATPVGAGGDFDGCQRRVEVGQIAVRLLFARQEEIVSLDVDVRAIAGDLLLSDAKVLILCQAKASECQDGGFSFSCVGLGGGTHCPTTRTSPSATRSAGLLDTDTIVWE